MNKRFWIISLVIGFGLLVLSVLGLSSLKMHRKGLTAERQQEFIEVAKQISFDVKKKVDTFLQTEQARLYTDYQPYYVPEIGSNPAALVPSPLANVYTNGFANGYFQLDSDGQLTSPYFAENPIQQTQQKLQQLEDHSDYFRNVRENLVPALQKGQTVATHRIEPTERDTMVSSASGADWLDFSRRGTRYTYTNTASESGENLQDVLTKQQVSQTETKDEQETLTSKQEIQVAAATKGSPVNENRSVYPISNPKGQQNTQVITQRRDNFDLNWIGNTAVANEEPVTEALETYNMSRAQSRTRQIPQQQSVQQIQMPQSQQEMTLQGDMMMQSQSQGAGNTTDNRPQMPLQQNAPSQTMGSDSQMGTTQPDEPDTVQGIIEPFVSMTVKDTNGGGNGLFSGQVFLLRHVQIEDRHLVQGFQLNEDELLTQITDSARQYVRRGMGYEISKTERPDASFAAILQFDFGEVVLNLLEQDPGFIQGQVVQIRNWFFGILAVVWLSVIIAMASMWKNLREQAVLSRKKDDFISAVSHELRTPLTSIRMYTEMLEKNWVKTDDKRRQYYTTMRTESERLTRLIENVLDFSRIQRGKKKYEFSLGDINQCIGEVADMMRPYIARAGFVLEQRYEVLPEFAFDRDAIVQIVINLLDNALKYARDAQDKHIIIRTRQEKKYVVIEVEDHGPGIARSQQKKIFDAFYRCQDESTRQTTGTGLGLALVKRFAEAHQGFVELVNAKPSGVCFRVGLAH